MPNGGNDVQEDMIVSQLDMVSYLIDDYLLHRTEDEIDVTYSGNYKEFLTFVKESL